MRNIFAVLAILFLLTVSLTSTVQSVFGASPSPAALSSEETKYATDSVKVLRQPVQVLGDEATPTGVLTSTVDQKLEELKRDIASKAAQLKSEVNKRIGNKALLGTVTVTSTDRLTIDSKNGSKTIKTNEYTLYQNDSKQKTKKAYSFDQIQTGDTLVSIGDIDETGALLAKKVVRVDPPQKKAYSYLSGQIGSVTNLAFVLELRGKPIADVSYTGKTFIQNGKAEGTSSDIKPGRRAVVILSSGTEASQSAFIYLPPETSVIKPAN